MYKYVKIKDTKEIEVNLEDKYPYSCLIIYFHCYSIGKTCCGKNCCCTNCCKNKKRVNNCLFKKRIDNRLIKSCYNSHQIDCVNNVVSLFDLQNFKGYPKFLPKGDGSIIFDKLVYGDYQVLINGCFCFSFSIKQKDTIYATIFNEK